MNALSPSMQADIREALDRAEAEGVVTVIRGRPGVFSAGFDLATRSLLGGFRPDPAGRGPGR